MRAQESINSQVGGVGDETEETRAARFVLTESEVLGLLQMVHLVIVGG